MYTIRHDIVINSSAEHVFNSVTQAEELDKWWTVRAVGIPALNQEYVLYFSPKYDWRANVFKCDSPLFFGLQFTEADRDWIHTKISFDIIPRSHTVLLRFEHSNWTDINDHFRRTSYSWALYLHCLKTLIETGESKPYNLRTV